MAAAAPPPKPWERNGAVSSTAPGAPKPWEQAGNAEATNASAIGDNAAIVARPAERPWERPGTAGAVGTSTSYLNNNNNTTNSYGSGLYGNTYNRGPYGSTYGSVCAKCINISSNAKNSCHHVVFHDESPFCMLCRWGLEAPTAVECMAAAAMVVACMVSLFTQVCLWNQVDFPSNPC